VTTRVRPRIPELTPGLGTAFGRLQIQLLHFVADAGDEPTAEHRLAAQPHRDVFQKCGALDPVPPSTVMTA
jgi:hypothetical protein